MTTVLYSPLIFAVCHLVALGSACANPVLYGWLNDNFRREFVAVLCRRCYPDVDGQRRSLSSHADNDRNAVDNRPRDSVSRARRDDSPVDTRLYREASELMCAGCSSSPRQESFAGKSDRESADISPQDRHTPDILVVPSRD